MAGIGFELRKLLKKDSLSGVLQAYTFAGVIGSGPWILSILGILIIGFLSIAVVVPDILIAQFQVSVTWLMAISLIFTGILQLGFTRYVSDRLFEKEDWRVVPNFNGALLLIISLTGSFGLVVAFTLFKHQSLLYSILMMTGFVILSAIWMATVLLSGLKEYKTIVALFAVGYTVTVLAALGLRPLGMEGLLLGFVIGNFVLLMGMITVIVRGYPSEKLIEFDFLRRGRMFPSLLLTGFLYNLGIWTDKFLFWFSPDTSEAVIGPLRASIIYDLPIFIAYLSVIPGMAVFLVRIETDFVEYYDRFYNAVREGGTLEHIENMRDEMVFVLRQGIFEIVKIQSLAVLLFFAIGPEILRLFNISQLYLPLTYIDMLAASLQVALMSVLNVLFYFDKRREALFVAALFVVLNYLLTSFTLQIGAPLYGYGFAVAVTLALLVSLVLLDRVMQRLEYETFMLQ